MVVGMPHGEGGRLGAALHAELGQQRRHVVLHRLFRQEHTLRDLPVGQPLADQIQDPLLLLGQRRHRVHADGALPQPGHDLPGTACLMLPAPAMMAPSSAWSSPYAVSIRHAVPGSAEEISRQTEMPSPSGSRTSRSATSGCSAGIRASAAAAVSASPITSMSASLASRARMPRRKISWSSTRKTLILSLLRLGSFIRPSPFRVLPGHRHRSLGGRVHVTIGNTLVIDCY